MTLDALKVALLAAGSKEESAAAALHAELEHFLDRQLDGDDLDAAVAELSAAGLVVMRETRFAATAAGRAVMLEQWETFFPS
jgi:hypothetical protein